jgi:hypothetical protein
MSQDKIFSKGIFFKRPNDTAPKYVLGKIKFKVEEAISFLQENINEGGWATVDVKESKDGKIYCELDTYVPRNMTDSGSSSGSSGGRQNEEEAPY